ncbi:MAG: hypothetical protein QG671_536 [Actinomycetota bacterium]|nr:hypothetical protein [Actinomycetota bacterium]
MATVTAYVTVVARSMVALSSLKELDIVEVGSAMDRAHRAAAPQGSRYQDQRRYVVAASLADLHGPTQGVVRLERALDWSADPQYDLENPGDLAVMYQTVLNQASTPAQLRRWLDGDTLCRIWPTLWLPPRVRAAWETTFPDLTGPTVLAG